MTAENQTPQTEVALVSLGEAAIQGLKDLAAGRVLEESELDDAVNVEFTPLKAVIVGKPAGLSDD